MAHDEHSPAAPTGAPVWDPYVRGCPTRTLLDRIGDRWTVLVVGVLARGGAPVRYSTIGREVQGISQKMLTQTLRNLERDGMVTRTVHAEVPPRVDYELTELGQSLRGAVAVLESWAREHMSEVARAREAFDSPTP